MFNLCSVVVCHRSMVNCRCEAFVYVHSAICETYLMWLYSIDLWLIGGVSTCARSICAFFYMLSVFSVVVSHISMVNWGDLCICVLCYM